MVVAVEVLGPLRLRIDGRDRPLPVDANDWSWACWPPRPAATRATVA